MPLARMCVGPFRSSPVEWVRGDAIRFLRARIFACAHVMCEGEGVTTNRPSLRERKKQATREALRAAALRLALERGPENVRVDDIAEAAGVSPRTYNNYFSSREQAIVAAVTAERASRVAAVGAAAKVALQQWLQSTTVPPSMSGFVVPSGSLPNLMRTALMPLVPALDAAATRSRH